MGYDWSKGKSERAVEAESGGLMVATKLAARIRRIGGRYRKCTAADISIVLAASEWHHSSKFFNKVNYYNMIDFAQLENRQILREAISERLAEPVRKGEWLKRVEEFKIEAARRGATRFIELSDGDYFLAAGPDGPPCKACIGELSKYWTNPFWKEEPK